MATLPLLAQAPMQSKIAILPMMSPVRPLFLKVGSLFLSTDVYSSGVIYLTRAGDLGKELNTCCCGQESAVHYYCFWHHANSFDTRLSNTSNASQQVEICDGLVRIHFCQTSGIYYLWHNNANSGLFLIRMLNSYVPISASWNDSGHRTGVVRVRLGDITR